jgi:hypothetical protein
MVISKKEDTVNALTQLIESDWFTDNIDIIVSADFKEMIYGRAIEKIKEALENNKPFVDLYNIDHNKKHVTIDRIFCVNILSIAAEFYKKQGKYHLSKECLEILSGINAKKVTCLQTTGKVDLYPLVWRVLQCPLFIRDANTEWVVS